MSRQGSGFLRKYDGYTPVWEERGMMMVGD